MVSGFYRGDISMRSGQSSLSALLYLIVGLLMFPAAVFSQSPIAGACPGMDKGTLKLRSDWTVPLLKSTSGAKAILLQSIYDADHDDNQMNVNSDGSPRAYHLLDPEGSKYALNDMYSGGVRIWENGVEQKMGTKNDDDATRHALRKHYYDVFNTFVKENDNFGVTESTYNPRSDPRYQVGDDFGNMLDPSQSTLSAATLESHATNADFGIGEPGERPAAAPVSEDLDDYNCLKCKQSDCKVCFRKHIITFQQGNLCIRKTGRYAGFLVNETGLDGLAGNAPDPENSQDKTCGASSNLDPEKLPGLVLPGSTISPDGAPALTANKGDVVVGYNPKSKKWVFGIVSDGGPPGKFGEASIAFNRTLQQGYKAGATFSRPVAYRADLLGDDYQPARPIAFLLLPGTLDLFKRARNPHDHPYDFSPQTVAAKAKASFLAWAGTNNMDKARQKYLQCLALLPPH
jgi:hypothetical protein